MTGYTYTKSPCAVDRLSQEIQMSSIASTFSHIDLLGSDLTIYFTADLSMSDQSVLSTIVANHNGTPLVSDFVELSSTTFTSTNNSSYAVLNGMQTQPLLPGTYMIMFSGTFNTTIPLMANPAIYVACFANGTIVPASEQSEATTVTGNVFNISFNCRVTIGPNQVIDIRWKNNGVLNTVGCFSRILDVMKVS